MQEPGREYPARFRNGCEGSVKGMAEITEHDPGPGAPLLSWPDLADGALVEAEACIDGAQESLIIHRTGNCVRAWLNVCPHAGRRLDWAPGRFLVSREGHLVCAAHGASFALETGECIAGPCRGQSLRAVAVMTDDVGLHLAPPAA